MIQTILTQIFSVFMLIISFVCGCIPGLVILIKTKTLKPIYALLIFILTFWSEIILISIMVGWTTVLKSQWIFFAFQIIISLLVISFSKVTNQQLSEYRTAFLEEIKTETLNIREACKDRFLLIFLGTIAMVSIYNLYLGIRIPANNNDSLSTHLVRVAYWFQHGTLLPWDTNQSFQIIYPINAQLIQLWILKFTGRDFLFALPQWTAVIGSGLLIYGILQQWKLPSRSALYAAGIYLCTPILVLQSSTTQTDAVIGFLALCLIYFLNDFSESHNFLCTVFLFVVVGIGIGVKQIFWFIIPGIGLLILALFTQNKQKWQPGKLVLVGVGIIVLLGGYIYFQNQILFGNPIGPERMLQEQTSKTEIKDLPQKLGINLLRFSYQAVDTSGLPDPLDGYAHKLKERTIGRLITSILPQLEGNQFLYKNHIFSITTKNNAQEDYAWYGIAGFVFGILGLYSGFRSGFKKSWYLFGTFGAGLLYIILIVLARPGWDAFQGRYFIPGFSIVFLFGSLIMMSWPKWIWRFFSLISLVLAVTCSLTNPSKPIIGDGAMFTNIWTTSRPELQSIQNTNFKDLILVVEQDIPEKAIVGLYIHDYAIQYTFFGKDFRRTIIPIYPLINLSNTDWLSTRHIEYIIANINDSDPRPPEVFEKVFGISSWKIFKHIK